MAQKLKINGHYLFPCKGQQVQLVQLVLMEKMEVVVLHLQLLVQQVLRDQLDRPDLQDPRVQLEHKDQQEVEVLEQLELQVQRGLQDHQMFNQLQ
jgi:hypothetical protein